jgi:hypothetical protein
MVFDDDMAGGITPKTSDALDNVEDTDAPRSAGECAKSQPKHEAHPCEILSGRRLICLPLNEMLKEDYGGNAHAYTKDSKS